MKHEEDQLGKVHTINNKVTCGSDPYPLCVEIHPTDICNQFCSYCFHGGNGFDKSRNSELLSTDQYTALFEELKSLNIKLLSISGGGEPFADKRTRELILFSNSIGLETRVITNGNLLKPEDCEALMGADQVRFSIDTLNPSTYNSMRKVHPRMLEKTLDNLSRLVMMKQELKSNLDIGVTCMVTPINYDEISDFCKYMSFIGVDAVMLKHDIYGSNVVSSEDFLNLERDLQELNSDIIDVRKQEFMSVKGKPCIVPFFKIALNPYGDVYSCCLGSQPGEKNGYLLGSIHKSSLNEIWSDSFTLRTSMRCDGVNCVSCNHTDYLLNEEYNEI